MRKGDLVDTNDRLGEEGATGNVTGRHLHLEAVSYTHLIKAAAAACGGGGGGKAEMAQAGGKDVSKIDEALQAAKDMVCLLYTSRCV